MTYHDIGSFLMGLEFAFNSIEYKEILKLSYIIRDSIPLEVLVEKIPMVFDKHFIDNSFIKASRDMYIKNFGMDTHIVILLNLMTRLSLRDRIKIIYYDIYSNYWEKNRNTVVSKEFFVTDNNMKDEYQGLEKTDLYRIIKEKDKEVTRLLSEKVYKSSIK